MAKLQQSKTDEYFAGQILIGDDYSLDQIQDWYQQESEAYANLGSKDKKNYSYSYHNQNILNGFNCLGKEGKYDNALGFGSAYGYEFFPIITQIRKLTIVEPSDNLRSDKIGDLIPVYVKPTATGALQFPDNTFDLIICFGVLHHIPNVTFVLGELLRVLSPNGFLLLKEPINTMGDWNYPRLGLTKNERGIPVKIFDDVFKENHIKVISANYIDSLFAYKILRRIFKIHYGSMLYTKFDMIISRMFSWNIKYHRTKIYQKIAPGGIFYVVRK